MEARLSNIETAAQMDIGPSPSQTLSAEARHSIGRVEEAMERVWRHLHQPIDPGRHSGQRQCLSQRGDHCCAQANLPSCDIVDAGQRSTLKRIEISCSKIATQGQCGFEVSAFRTAFRQISHCGLIYFVNVL